MKAAVLYERKGPLVVEDPDLAPPKTGEARVKIVANGICHSDLSIMNGVLPFPMPDRARTENRAGYFRTSLGASLIGCEFRVNVRAIARKLFVFSLCEAEINFRSA
jgi:threonine dehydrogenase-like Zn-dependent dehydrogenase